MANQVEKLNTIAIADIEAINGLNDAAIEGINGLEFTGVVPYTGITWSTDDTIPITAGYWSVFGNKGALGITTNVSGESYQRTYEHDGSSWSTGGNTNARHSVSQTGGTQSAGVIYGGYTGSDESNVTEEYDGSSWATGNNMVTGTNGGIGGGLIQTAQLVSGGSSYNPTVRDISTTQTYNGTNWANESVASAGKNTGTSGENGSGLDSFLAASGTLNSGVTAAVQLFNQSASSWTTKTSASVAARYLGCGSDGVRIYKFGGVNNSASGGFTAANMKDMCESWVENTWTTENSMPATRSLGGGSGSLTGTGENCAVGGLNYNSSGVGVQTTSFYVSSAS